MSLHVRDKVEDLSHREPLFVASHETLRTVAHILATEHVGVLVVGTAREPLGVISERDVVAQLGRGVDPDSTTAEEAMTKHFAWARVRDPLFDAATRMLTNGFRHLPVIDDDGYVVGMVSMRDLVQPLLLDAWGG